MLFNVAWYNTFLFSVSVISQVHLDFSGYSSQFSFWCITRQNQAKTKLFWSSKQLDITNLPEKLALVGKHQYVSELFSESFQWGTTRCRQFFNTDDYCFLLLTTLSALSCSQMLDKITLKFKQTARSPIPKEEQQGAKSFHKGAVSHLYYVSLPTKRSRNIHRLSHTLVLRRHETELL